MALSNDAIIKAMATAGIGSKFTDDSGEEWTCHGRDQMILIVVSAGGTSKKIYYLQDTGTLHEADGGVWLVNDIIA